MLVIQVFLRNRLAKIQFLTLTAKQFAVFFLKGDSIRAFGRPTAKDSPSPHPRSITIPH